MIDAQRITTVLAVLLWSGGAVANQPDPPVDQDGEVIYVRGSSPREGVDDLDGDRESHADAERALAEPAFVTVLHVSNREGETTSVTEVLAESVGVNTRSLGGLGSFASVSIRGASPNHTMVLIDGIPLSRFAAAAADLSSFDLTSFEIVEVYRGGIPVDFGGASLGGAINFTTAVGPEPDGDTVRLSLGGGSFGARHLRGRWGDALADGRLGLHAAVGYRAADGDYEYFNDNGTSLNPDDDAFVDRTNNGFYQGNAELRGRWLDGGTTVEGGSRTMRKVQGLPGVGSVQTDAATLSTWSELLDLRARTIVGRALYGMSGYLSVERESFDDRLGEVGLGIDDHVYRTMTGGTAARGVWRLGDLQVLSASVEGAVDRFTDEDLVDATAGALEGTRLGGAISVADEVTVAGGRVVLVPGARVDALRTRPGAGWDPSLIDPAEVANRTDWFASPRLAVRGRVTEALVIKSSAGRYFRAPTLTETFGDRGFVVGNPSLEAETGVSADLGLVFAPGIGFGAVDRIYLQSAGFVSRPRDAIAFVPTAGGAALAKNLGDAVIYGVEAAATLRLWHSATLSANYTAVDSEQDSPMPSFDGKRLPLRPRHQAYLRVDVARRVLGHLAVVWSDVAYTSGNVLDAANMNEVPARRFVGTGLKLAPRRGLVVAVEAKNLTNERVEAITLDPPPRPDLAQVPRAVSDVLGYPLPGRSYYLTLDWSF